MSIVLITHDIGLVAELADKVIIMYAGQFVEETSVYRLFEHPAHPYTGLFLNRFRVYMMIRIRSLHPSPVLFRSIIRISKDADSMSVANIPF